MNTPNDSAPDALPPMPTSLRRRVQQAAGSGASAGPDSLVFASSTGRVAAYAIGLFLLSAVLVFSLGAYLQSKVDLGLGLLVTEILLIGLPAAMFLRCHRHLMPATVWQRQRRGSLLRVLVTAVLAAVASIGAGTIWRRSVGSLGDLSQMPGIGEPLTMVLLVGSLWILAPVCEELLFRVSIQSALSTLLPAGAAVLWTSLLFGLFHGALERLAETTLLGLFLGLIYQRTGSYRQVVAFHAVVNLLGGPLFVLGTNLNTVLVLLVASVALVLALCVLPRCSTESGTKHPTGINWWGRDWRPTLAVKAAGLRRGVILGMAGILVVGLTLEIHLHVTATPATPFPLPGQCEQEWRLQAGGNFRVTERLSLTGATHLPARFTQVAPGARLQSASLDGELLPCKPDGQGWSVSGAATSSARQLALEWQVPLTALPQSNDIRWLDMRIIAPVDGLKIILVLDPDCGFEDPDQPMRRRVVPFSMSGANVGVTHPLGRVGFSLRPAREQSP